MPLPPAPDWPTVLKPGSRIFLSSGAACPLRLAECVLEHARAQNDLEFVHSLLLGPTPWTAAEHQPNISVNAFILDPRLSELVNAGLDDYTPAHHSDIPSLFRDDILPLDIALVSITPPDRHGYCSLGPQVELTPSAMDAASIVIGQINPNLPRTHGLSFIHLSQLDYVIDGETRLPEWPTPELDEADLMIGAYVAQLIEDGDTLQVGVGRTGHAVLANLGSHRHLGIHTETIGDAIQALFEEGVIDNTRKTLLPGKIIAANALGSRGFYEFLHDNPHVDLRPTEFVANPLTIARNERMVAVQGVLQSDLTGQLVVDSVRGRFRSGMGSHADFLRGAALSPRGRPIVAMRSSSRDAEGRLVSNLLPDLPPGAGIGISRADVHYLVTEYGIATLRGRTIRERVAELIQVAHPELREDLVAAAHARNLVPKTFQLPPPYEESSDGIQVRKVRLKDTRDYILRPLNPSDDRRLQAFFYSHTEETIIRRYGFTVTRMSRERAFELVGVDQNIDLALGLFELQGPRQVIHAVGRYYLDRNGKSAEIAFVVGEQKRRSGMARCLLERMLEIARKRKVLTLWAQVDRDNAPMLKLFRQYGAKELPGDDLHTVRIEIETKEATLTGIAQDQKVQRWHLPFKKKPL
jgi:acyl-CoA hydrolase/RimJ/RimL family protein N-acetyltransferase